MHKIRGPTWSEDDVSDEIREVVAMDQIEQELEASASYFDCFKGTDHRRTRIAIMTLGEPPLPIYICLSLAEQNYASQSFSNLQGSRLSQGESTQIVLTATTMRLILYPFRYGTYFFSISGISDAFTITVITSICGLAGSASAFPLVKYFGRRPLLIVGGIVCSFSMLIFAIVGAAKPNSVAAAKCLVAFTCTYIFTYGATWGPIPQAVIGEIPSNSLRAKTVSIATSVNWLCTTFIICGTPYLLSTEYVMLGAKLGFIFGGCTILGTIWVFLELPETKDRTLEQIDEMFLNVGLSSYRPLVFLANQIQTARSCSQVQELRLHRTRW